MADETHDTPPLSVERLAYIRSGVEAGSQGWGYVARSTIAELLAEIDRLRAVNTAMYEIVAAVARAQATRPLRGEVEFPVNVDVATLIVRARALLDSTRGA